MRSAAGGSTFSVDVSKFLVSEIHSGDCYSRRCIFLSLHLKTRRASVVLGIGSLELWIRNLNFVGMLSCSVDTFA